MPTYQYTCEECTHEMEVFHKITDQALKQCSNCGKEALRRGPGGGIGLAFKGSGFYINDYAAPAGSGSSEPTAPAVKKECCPCGKNKGSCSTD